MAKKIRTIPRKSPNQERARATVEVLIEACTRILIREGYDRASTNRIAEEAGVSIGSLYQYFPSKEALVATLIERMLEEDRRLIERHLLASMPEPIGELAPRLVEALLEAYSSNPRLRKVLIQEVPRVGRLQRVQKLKEDIAELLIQKLRTHSGKTRVKDPELAAFLLVNAMEGILYASVFDWPKHFDRERLAPEVSALVLRYLF
ncbi:MAG: TetR/AcrR family transcriptional regulator [Bdellovibrionota bacterium]